MNCFVSACLVERSILSVPQRRRPACRTQYKCAQTVAENCPQTAANAKMSRVVRGLRGTAVFKLSEVCMSVQLLCRYTLVKLVKESWIRIKITYHFWKCDDAVYRTENHKKIVHSCRNYRLPKLARFLRQWQCRYSVHLSSMCNSCMEAGLIVCL